MKFDFGRIFLSKGVNYFTDDLPLQRMLEFFGFKRDEDIVEMGRYVSESMIESAAFIDHYSKPVMRTWGILDERLDGVWLSPDHYEILKELQRLGAVRKSIVAKNLMYHFLSGYVVSDSGIFCTLTLTAQTAYGLAKYGSSRELKEYLDKYTAIDDPWYGATYYSEIQGGSDLGSNNTTASESENLWLLNGTDKYFASNAGVADGAVVTARIQGDSPGAKGLSVFFVPAIRSDGSPNYTIRRLKDKLGTISVPTGEVEFFNSEGYMLGERKKGIYYAMEILTVSRIDDAIAACGIARKSLWEAYRYANKRQAFGKAIIDHSLLRRDFLEMESDLEAAVVLSLIAAERFSQSQNSVPPYSEEYHVARMMSHIAKNMASEYGSRITQYCLEVFGGKGFLTEFPVEKFHRDELVTSIWEGTSNIQALDLLEIIRKKMTHATLFNELESMISALPNQNRNTTLRNAFSIAKQEVQEMLGSENPEFYGKEVLRKIGEITAAVFLKTIAEKENSPEITAMTEVFCQRHFADERLSPELMNSAKYLSWMESRS